jgi:hypothetical protein
MNCWICENPATTGEHGMKRSDLKAGFGTISQRDPLYLHNTKKQNRPIGSFDAKPLKLPGQICAYCNNTRTQRYDRAWERLSQALRIWEPAIKPRIIIWPKRVFGSDYAREMLNVHLFFVKLFGCHIAGNSIPIGLGGFKDAILHAKAHPRVYLKFGCGRMLDGKPLRGWTDMWVARPNVTGFGPFSVEVSEASFATWYYDVGFVGINVMYALPGERRQGLAGAWHPRQLATRLVMADWRTHALPKSAPTPAKLPGAA